jgi:hypothetical protein
MDPKVREEAMRRKVRADVRRASMTYEKRVELRKRGARSRALMRVVFFIGGFLCGLESIAEIAFLLFFGIVGPIGLHYDMI